MVTPFEPLVLLVEDNDDDALLATEALRRSACFPNVRRVRDGWEALSALADRECDLGLVVLDLNMPVMDGFEVLEALEAEHAGNTEGMPPVVLLSSSDDPAERARARAHAIVSDYLVKPLTRRLVERLHAIATTPATA